MLINIFVDGWVMDGIARFCRGYAWFPGWIQRTQQYLYRAAWYL